MSDQHPAPPTRRPGDNLMTITEAPDAIEIADVARRLAAAKGLDLSTTLSQLHTAVRRGLVGPADHVYVNVSTDEALRAYAQAVGREVESLTDGERRHAIGRAILEEAERVSATAEASGA